jgi:adenylate kinase
MKYRTVLLFGAPGSGKGTQGRILGQVPDFFYFSCGDAFRNLRIDDPIGRTFIDFSSRGLLVPDEITIKLWSRNIEASTMDGSFNPTRDTLILDGIPRNPKQAEMLKDTLDVKGMLHLACLDQAKMIERLQRRALRENRLDDANLEVIKKRLETYEKDTEPVLNYYGPKLVHQIDSSEHPVKVLRQILDVLVRL